LEKNKSNNVEDEKAIKRRLKKISQYFLRIFRLHYHGTIIMKLFDGKITSISEKCNSETDLTDSTFFLEEE